MTSVLSGRKRARGTITKTPCGPTRSAPSPALLPIGWGRAGSLWRRRPRSTWRSGWWTVVWCWLTRRNEYDSERVDAGFPWWSVPAWGSRVKRPSTCTTTRQTPTTPRPPARPGWRTLTSKWRQSPPTTWCCVAPGAALMSRCCVWRGCVRRGFTWPSKARAPAWRCSRCVCSTGSARPCAAPSPLSLKPSPTRWWSR